MDRLVADLLDWLAAPNGAALEPVGDVEDEANNPGFLLQLGHDARLDALQHSGHRHKERGLQGSHVVGQLLHIPLYSDRSV
jgi:hypothetical protein